MGLFSTHSRAVYASSSPLMTSSAFTMEDAVLYAVLKDRSISKTIVDVYTTGMSNKVDLARKYAKEYYVLGLPNAYHSNSQHVDDSVVATAITDNLSLPYGCLVAYNVIAPLDAGSMAIPYLVGTRGMSIETGKITELPAGWVIPDTQDGLLVHEREPEVTAINMEEDDVTITITYSVSPYVLVYTRIAQGEYVWVEEPLTVGSYQETFTESFTVSSNYQLFKDYLIAGYYEMNADGTSGTVINWWYYSMSAGTYPSLIPIVTEDNVDVSYPVVPIRYDNKFISTDNSPEVYRTGKKLLQKMQISFDDLVDLLDENPDIADIDHAYVMFGINFQTEDQLSLRYLITFFDYIAGADDQSIWDALAGTADGLNQFSFGSKFVDSEIIEEETESIVLTGEAAKTVIINPVNSLTLTEHGLHIRLDYRYITSSIVEGSIGDIGEVTKEIFPDYDYEKVGSFAPIRRDNSKVYLREQITVDKYREVLIVGLTHYNEVHGDRFVVTTAETLINEPDNNNFIIPLHHTVVQRFSRLDRNPLYENSLHIVLNSYVVTKLKWYAQGWFQLVITIVGMVITAFTGQAWVLGLTTAVDMGVQALLMFLLTTLVRTVVMSFAAKLLVDIVGPEYGMIIAIVAVAISQQYGSMMDVNVAGSTFCSAEMFMNIGASIAKSVNDALNQLIQDVSSEYSDFMVDAEAQEEILRAKQELLETEYLLPFSYLEPAFSYPKPEVLSDPSLLYDKVHVGNVGTLALSVIENYHSTALLLPEAELL